jgi:hypothetical protein
VKKLRKKIRFFKLNLNLIYFITVCDTVHVRIFIKTFHLVTKRYRCADFYVINEGPQDTCSINIY